MGASLRGIGHAVGALDFVLGVVEGVGFGRVALDGGTETICFLAQLGSGPVAQRVRPLLDVDGELLGAAAAQQALEPLLPAATVAALRCAGAGEVCVDDVELKVVAVAGAGDERCLEAAL